MPKEQSQSIHTHPLDCICMECERGIRNMVPHRSDEDGILTEAAVEEISQRSRDGSDCLCGKCQRCISTDAIFNHHARMDIERLIETVESLRGKLEAEEQEVIRLLELFALVPHEFGCRIQRRITEDRSLQPKVSQFPNDTKCDCIKSKVGKPTGVNGGDFGCKPPGGD